MVTLLFDGGMVFSMYSTARWEALVVMVPLVLGVAGRGAKPENAFSSHRDDAWFT
jgi:hypothetical protein